MAPAKLVAATVQKIRRHRNRGVLGAAGKPPDLAIMAALFRRHGMTIAAPPPRAA